MKSEEVNSIFVNTHSVYANFSDFCRRRYSHCTKICVQDLKMPWLDYFLWIFDQMKKRTKQKKNK